VIHGSLARIRGTDVKAVDITGEIAHDILLGGQVHVRIGDHDMETEAVCRVERADHGKSHLNAVAVIIDSGGGDCTVQNIDLRIGIARYGSLGVHRDGFLMSVPREEHGDAVRKVNIGIQNLSEEIQIASVTRKIRGSVLNVGDIRTVVAEMSRVRQRNCRF